MLSFRKGWKVRQLADDRWHLCAMGDENRVTLDGEIDLRATRC
jgi:hypothetical protein